MCTAEQNSERIAKDGGNGKGGIIIERAKVVNILK